MKDLQIVSSRKLAIEGDQILYISGWALNDNNGRFTIEAYVDADASMLTVPDGPPDREPDKINSGGDANPFLTVAE